MKINKISIIFISFLLNNISSFSENLYFEIEKPKIENFIVINIRGNPNHKTNKSYDFHRVEKGDYLNKIAKEYDKKTKKLVEINEIKNPDLIFPKQKIYLNNKKTLNMEEVPKYHIVKYGENIIEIASYYELDFKKLIELNDLRKENNYVLYPNQKLKLKE